MRRTPGGILLILILVFQFSGNHLLFHFQRARIKHEIKQLIKSGVPQSKQFHFAFAKNNNALHWQNDHEFQYLGIMYDVLHKIESKDSLYLQCISDQQETQLFASLDKAVNNKWHRQQQNNKRTPLLTYTYLPASLCLLPTDFHMNVKGLFGYNNRLTIQEYTPESPPPKIMIS